MKISIVIPNYNGEDLLRQNMPFVYDAMSFYLKKYTGNNVEVIYADDGSQDKSSDIIEEFIKKNTASNIEYKILKNKLNKGFSSTVNKGVQEATGEIVVLLNTDVIPQQDFIAPLIESFDNEKVFAVGCLDKSKENGKIILRGRGLGKWDKGFLVHSRGEATETNTLWVSGGSGAFKRSTWNILGGMEILYDPFYYEDIDLSYRALKSGYRILFNPKSIVIHEHGKGSVVNTKRSEEIQAVVYRNQFLFVWLNATDITLIFSHIFWLPYHFIIALKTRNTAFLKGFFHAFILLPNIIKSNLKRRVFYKMTDAEVIGEFIE